MPAMGKVGRANSTPHGFVGEMFKAIGPYVAPPAGAQISASLGHARPLHSLFDDRATSATPPPTNDAIIATKEREAPPPRWRIVAWFLRSDRLKGPERLVRLGAAGSTPNVGTGPIPVRRVPERRWRNERSPSKRFHTNSKATPIRERSRWTHTAQPYGAAVGRYHEIMGDDDPRLIAGQARSETDGGDRKLSGAAFLSD